MGSVDPGNQFVLRRMLSKGDGTTSISLGSKIRFGPLVDRYPINVVSYRRKECYLLRSDIKYVLMFKDGRRIKHIMQSENVAFSTHGSIYSHTVVFGMRLWHPHTRARSCPSATASRSSFRFTSSEDTGEDGEVLEGTPVEGVDGTDWYLDQKFWYAAFSDGLSSRISQAVSVLAFGDVGLGAFAGGAVGTGRGIAAAFATAGADDASCSNFTAAASAGATFAVAGRVLSTAGGCDGAGLALAVCAFGAGGAAGDCFGDGARAAARAAVGAVVVVSGALAMRAGAGAAGACLGIGAFKSCSAISFFFSHISNSIKSGSAVLPCPHTRPGYCDMYSLNMECLDATRTFSTKVAWSASFKYLVITCSWSFKIFEGDSSASAWDIVPYPLHSVGGVATTWEASFAGIATEGAILSSSAGACIVFFHARSA